VPDQIRSRSSGTASAIPSALHPPADADGTASGASTLAFVARAQGRAIVSLTRVRAHADDGQNVVMQRTLVSDLFSGRRFSLTVYEDHAISDAAVRLMGGDASHLPTRGLAFPVELLEATT
jgi:hypothetical protein